MYKKFVIWVLAMVASVTLVAGLAFQQGAPIKAAAWQLVDKAVVSLKKATGEPRHLGGGRFPTPPMRTSPELAKAESFGTVVLTRPTATSQVFKTPFDGEKNPQWISSAPNVVSVHEGVMWPLNAGLVAICIHEKCFAVESKPNWMQEAPKNHDHSS